MSEWRGLCNYLLHDPNEETAGATAWCQCCGAIDCRPTAPCWCCEVHRAEAEVERLTAALADRDRRIEAALVACRRANEDFRYNGSARDTLAQIVGALILRVESDE